MDVNTLNEAVYRSGRPGDSLMDGVLGSGAAPCFKSHAFLENMGFIFSDNHQLGLGWRALG